jgi:hypothetical protein
MQTARIQSFPTKPTAVLGLVPVDNHWIPFMWTWNVKCMIAASWDVPGTPSNGLSVLHQGLATAVGAQSFTVHVVHRRFAVEEFCGLCALRFLDYMLRGKLLPSTLDEVRQLHATARSLFVEFLDSCATVSRPWIWCAGLDTKAADRLNSLLLEHGVESSQVKNRAALLIQAVGLSGT